MKKNQGFTLLEGLICMAIAWQMLALVAGLALPYTVNSWLVVAGKEPAWGFCYGYLCGLFPPAAIVSIPAAIITFIAMFFVG